MGGGGCVGGEGCVRGEGCVGGAVSCSCVGVPVVVTTTGLLVRCGRGDDVEGAAGWCRRVWVGRGAEGTLS